MGVEAHHGHGAVGYGGLVFADHLVAVGHAADAAVADGNQEVFWRLQWAGAKTR